ncbi:hypothetical protein MRX96_048199 [Rhipicephalus microplus]
MKSTFVLALSFATVASYAQGEEDPMGRGALPPPDVAHNIVAVAEMLARFFVPEEEAVHNLHGHLKAVETCLRRGNGLKLDLITKSIEMGTGRNFAEWAGPGLGLARGGLVRPDNVERMGRLGSARHIITKARPGLT